MTKTVITIEIFQRTTIRSRKAARFVRCEQCAADAPSEAAAQLENNTLAVLRLTGAGEMRFEETERALMPICGDCLSTRYETES